MYTVGPDYAHAEARKSPALDGKVERDSEGKEIRYPVMLTAMEKLVARKVCVAFKVCIFFAVQGRTPQMSDLCQGWSDGSPPCLMPVAGPAGCGSLLGRGDWEGKRACSRCLLGWQVPGVPHTSEHLILHPEHAALHLTCAHSVLTISCFCLYGKFGLAFLIFFFFLHFDTCVWFFCLFGLFVYLVLVFFQFLGFFKIIWLWCKLIFYFTCG